MPHVYVDIGEITPRDLISSQEARGDIEVRTFVACRNRAGGCYQKSFLSASAGSRLWRLPFAAARRCRFLVRPNTTTHPHPMLNNESIITCYPVPLPCPAVYRLRTITSLAAAKMISQQRSIGSLHPL